MSPRKTSGTSSALVEGLRLSGTVESRAKRFVPKENPTAEVVTYAVGDGTGKTYFLQDYSPKSYFDVGERIDVPVYIKPYQKNNVISYTINIQKPRQGHGEAF